MWDLGPSLCLSFAPLRPVPTLRVRTAALTDDGSGVGSATATVAASIAGGAPLSDPCSDGPRFPSGESGGVSRASSPSSAAPRMASRTRRASPRSSASAWCRAMRCSTSASVRRFVPGVRSGRRCTATRASTAASSSLPFSLRRSEPFVPFGAAASAGRRRETVTASPPQPSPPAAVVTRWGAPRARTGAPAAPPPASLPPLTPRPAGARPSRWRDELTAPFFAERSRMRARS